MAETERVQKILSQWGVASRRQAEQFILTGRVRLNGAIAQLGDKADPNRDVLEVDGQRIHARDRPQLIYLLLHKPAGIVSTCQDPEGRMTVLDLLPDDLRQGTGIHPVGRLDTNSTGALILTNDGALTHALTHPSHEIAKAYRVWVKGDPSDADLEQWRRGIRLVDDLSTKRTLPAQVTVLDIDPAGQTLLQVVIREGRNRQIRRVAEQLGYPVLRLHRIAIASIKLGKIPSGQYRFLTHSELESLRGGIKFPDPLLPEN
jgi:23S rRNA pseudouridine2605 synthase